MYINSTDLTFEQISQAGGDLNGMGMTVEASSLRWSPGFNPDELKVTFTSGAVVEFVKIDCDESKIQYDAKNLKLTFVIWND